VFVPAVAPYLIVASAALAAFAVGPGRAFGIAALLLNTAHLLLWPGAGPDADQVVTYVLPFAAQVAAALGLMVADARGGRERSAALARS
jgi:hypothetical protein